MSPKMRMPNGYVNQIGIINYLHLPSVTFSSILCQSNSKIYKIEAKVNAQ
jgi:hypothetical protein